MKKNEDVVETTKSAQIWNKIKNAKIEMFSLPDQTVSMHVSVATVEPSKCYLVPKAATAVLPAIEAALPGFNVEQVNKYIVVSEKLA